MHLPATRSNDTLLRRWCQYWCLMAVFTALQPLGDTFLFWLPLYYEAKLALAVYLWANGAAEGGGGACSFAAGLGLCCWLCCCRWCCRWWWRASQCHCLARWLTHLSLHPSRLRATELAGAQYVWGRWFQPAVAQYEPLVDRRLAESKAVAKDWLHSNTMRLVALAQARVLAWLAAVQQQAAQAASLGRGGGGGGSPAAGRAANRQVEYVVLDDDEEEEEESDAVAALGGRETRSGRRRLAAAAAVPVKRPSGRGEGSKDKGVEAAVPGEELQTRRSSFSLHTFFSARSGDLQQQDISAGLKAFPILAQQHSPDRDD